MPRSDVKFQEFVPLGPYTTLGIGGPARFFCRVTSPEQLLEAVLFGRSCGLPLFVLGGGSNLLVLDSGFPGLVIEVAIDHAILVDGGYQEGGLPAEPLTYQVPAGLNWNAFVLAVAEAAVSGVECLAGIPGLVGGSPIQNIGAYGQEAGSTIAAVTALDLETLQLVVLDRGQCGFGYRSSIFNTTQRNRYIVTSVTFQFDLNATPNLNYSDLARHFSVSGTDADAGPTPLEVYHAVREIRRRKGMLIVEGSPDSRSAGSFFKNPVVPVEQVAQIAKGTGCSFEEVPQYPAGGGLVKLAAAWLVERAGFYKGFAMGRAAISSRHALALVNLGGATAAEVIALRNAVIAEVEQRFGVRLEQEPVTLGV